MKKMLACLSAAAVLSLTCAGGALGALPASAEENTIDVWLIGGQSNAVGYAQGLPQTNDDPRFSEGFDNVLFWGEYESDVSSVLPTDFVPVKAGYGKAYSTSDRRSGAELGIASALGDSGTMNAVIKYAWGATFLYPDTTNAASTNYGTWTPPSYREEHSVGGGKIGILYDNFLDIVAEGLNKLEEKGYTPVIRGMWWMQGEAEANTKTYADAYYELLTDLISDLRSDLTQVTGQDCSSMPFVIGKIYRNPAYSAMSQIETIRAAQEQAAQTLVNVATVDCTGLAQQDGWHFTADAQLYLGEQFVQKVTGMDGKYWVSCASDYIDFSGGGAKQQGETVTITVSARRGYRIEDVTMQIGMQEPVSVTLTNGRYTFVMPESNVSFTVNAQALELYQLTKYESNDASMGSIYPSAEARAGWYEGEQVQIFVRPAEGYTVARATVNGTEIAAVGEQNDGLVYELNVAADVEFYVEFASEQTQPAPPEEPSDETPENNPNTGLWVGIGVGGAVIVAAAVALVVIFVRKRK